MLPRVKESSAALLRWQFVDSLRRPVGTDLTAATCTLFNESDGAILNSRNAQTVYGANGGTYTPTVTITDIDRTDPVRITAAGHPLRTGDRIHISGVVGATELNGRTFDVTRVSDDEFDLVGVDGCDISDYVSGGTGKVGILELALGAADNVLSGSPANGVAQRHIARVDVTVGGRVSAASITFEVVQEPRP